MAIFRLEKNKNYTVMSNYHLRDKNLSLKAKGLLSFMLSLPDDWDYSLNGLVKVLKENETSIKTALKELKKYGYLKVEKLLPNQTKSAKIEYIYNIYENPNKQQDIDNQEVENLGVEIQGVENQTQINTNKQNTKKINTKEYYGEYKNVFFTDEQYEKLLKEFPNDYEERIQRLDDYMQSTGKKYKDCLATIRVWAKKDGNNKEYINSNQQKKEDEWQ